MSNNLPPGITESMIPGNRPEDQEIEVTITLTKDDLDYLVDYHGKYPQDDNIRSIVDEILEQINDFKPDGSKYGLYS